MTSDRQLLVFIVDGGSNDRSPKSGEREVFVGGSVRRNDRCVSRSALVGGKNRRRRGILKPLRAMRYYYFLCPPGPRGPAYSGGGGGGGEKGSWRK